MALRFFIFWSVLLLGAVPALSAITERIQRFKGVEVTQSWDPGCVKLSVKYHGRMAGEESLQVYVDLNGANRIFNMTREDDKYVLNLSSCPTVCEGKKTSANCAENPAEMRRLFYWAMSNGQPASWFVQTTFMGKGATMGRENYGFYFP